MMNIIVNKLRITKLIMDTSGPMARWFVSGYYITNNDTFMGEFLASSEVNPLATEIYTPSVLVQQLSSQLLTAMHEDLESATVLRHEQKSS
jgi:hypothetical protein